MLKLKKWIKPGTSEVRVYFESGSKAYICDNGSTDGWTVKAYGLYPSQLDSLMNRVEDELAELNGGERFTEFSRVLELAA